MVKKLLLLILLVSSVQLRGQSYTSYLLGDPADAQTTSNGGFLLAGGGTDNDTAMAWFLTQANGGDVVVLRTDHSSAYNTYLYSQLGVQVNSVETLIVPSHNAANAPYVKERLLKAEAIFIAGGDQTEYYNLWHNTAIDTILSTNSINSPVIGGTSAGMMILGDFDYYPATYGVISSEALNNPYHPYLDTIIDESLIERSKLKDLIFDTHFDQLDRKGRLVTQLARTLSDYGKKTRAIGVNEVTAIAIDKNGLAQVYGEYPDYNDFAYFIEPTCPLTWINYLPEQMTPEQPLTWNYDGQVLKVLKVAGTLTGSDTLDITNFSNTNAGQWFHWYINDGELIEVPLNSEPACFDNLSFDQYHEDKPYYFSDQNTINFKEENVDITIYNTVGQTVGSANKVQSYSLHNLNSGIYIINYHLQGGTGTSLKWFKN